MSTFRISIQETIKAFNQNGLIGETTIERIEDFCKKYKLDTPLIWNETESTTIEIIKQYFEENHENNI